MHLQNLQKSKCPKSASPTDLSTCGPSWRRVSCGKTHVLVPPGHGSLTPAARAWPGARRRRVAGRDVGAVVGVGLDVNLPGLGLAVRPAWQALHAHRRAGGPLALGRLREGAPTALARVLRVRCLGLQCIGGAIRSGPQSLETVALWRLTPIGWLGGRPRTGGRTGCVGRGELCLGRTCRASGICGEPMRSIARAWPR